MVGGHGVADAVDDEGGLVADNGIGTCPETSHHEILEALGGKTSQPVDAVGRSFDGAGLLEVPQLLSGDMVALGLGRGEIASLRLSQPVEDALAFRHRCKAILYFCAQPAWSTASQACAWRPSRSARSWIVDALRLSRTSRANRPRPTFRVIGEAKVHGVTALVLGEPQSAESLR